MSNAFDTKSCKHLALADADICYYPAWMSITQADASFSRLKAELAWRQDEIKLFGKRHKIPRLQAWYGDSTAVYRYTNLTMQPLPWHPHLMSLKTACEAQCCTTFNSVLANFYRHGRDSMGMHADDEPELGQEPVIASLSLGQTRPFILRHKHTKERHTLDLTHGSLLVMRGTTQQYWQHGINKSQRPLHERINLTFRYVYA